MIILFYLLTTFLCLFILFSVARHDFVLIRQSISLRQVFDNAFLALISGFFFGRLFFALDNRIFDILNPLRFFYLTRYEGFLLFAGFIGTYIALFLLYRKKKNKLRIFDIYSISFFPLAIFDVLIKSNNGVEILLKVVAVVVLLSFYAWFLKVHNEFSIKDGVITVLGSISYALVLLAFSFAHFGVFKLSHLPFQLVLIVTTIISSFLMLLIHRDTSNKK